MEKVLFDVGGLMAMHLALGPSPDIEGLACHAILSFLDVDDSQYLEPSFRKFYQDYPEIAVRFTPSSSSANLWQPVGSEAVAAELKKIHHYSSVRRCAQSHIRGYQTHLLSFLPLTYCLLDDGRLLLCMKHHYCDGITGLFWLDRLLRIIQQFKANGESLQEGYGTQFLPGNSHRLLKFSHYIKASFFSPYHIIDVIITLLRSRRYAKTRVFLGLDASDTAHLDYQFTKIEFNYEDSRKIVEFSRKSQVKLISVFCELVVDSLLTLDPAKHEALLLVSSFLKPYLTNDRFAILPYNSLNHVYVTRKNYTMRRINKRLSFTLGSAYGFSLLAINSFFERNLIKVYEKLRRKQKEKLSSIDQGPVSPSFCLTNLGELTGTFIERLCVDLDFYLLAALPSLFVYSYKQKIKVVLVANLSDPQRYHEFIAIFRSKVDALLEVRSRN